MDVVSVLRARSAEIERGAIVSIGRISSRMQVLPVRRDGTSSTDT